MLAIVIPYYNTDFFKATLQSLKKQTDKRFKVYIGNDGSPNNPEVLIEQYRKSVAIVYKGFKNNLGHNSLVGHWERCIDLITDEKWMLILGDDDVLSPDYVSQFYKEIDKIAQLNIDVIRSSTQLIDSKGLVISDLYIHPELENAIDSFVRVTRQESRSSLSEYIFSRKAYEKWGFKNFPLAWHSDDLAWLEFSNFGNIYSLSNCKAFIRLSEVNISGKSDDSKLKQAASFQFYWYLLTQKRKQLTSDFLKEVLVKTRFYLFKTGQLGFRNWRIIVLHLLMRFEFKEAIQFTKKYIRKKYE